MIIQFISGDYTNLRADQEFVDWFHFRFFVYDLDKSNYFTIISHFAALYQENYDLNYEYIIDVSVCMYVCA